MANDNWKMENPKLPDFKEEKRLWKKGYHLVIGVDEVGRGAFAGPVVAAGVAFGAEVGKRFLVSCNCGRGKCRAQNHLASPRFNNLIKIDDSKRLTPLARKKSAKWIKQNCLASGIGEVGVRTINRVGIGKATSMAMRRAIAQILRDKTEKSPKILVSQYPNIFVLVDAFHIKYLRGIGLKNQKAIKKGDQKSISIAAASILAKVFRDSLMQRLAKRYRKYRWGSNKGYGTKLHQQVIIQYGMTSFHRRQFVETFLSSSSILKE